MADPPAPPTDVVGGPAPPAPPAAVYRRFGFLAPPRHPGDLGGLGPYRVVDLIGEGGMGYVFRAEDEALGRPVALKVLRPELAHRADAADRFQREGKAAAAVRSDHVVTIYAVGRDNDVPYLVMELLDGVTLDAWLSARPARAATPPEAVRIARDALRGLAAAHQKGLVHRDLKPDNLWVERPTRRVKVLDFGLARTADGSDRLTTAGAVLGSPAYMAPEQARGLAVDARADLFSLGAVLYRALAGNSPFARGSPYETLTALALDDPPPLAEAAPAVPPDLSAWVARLMSKDAADRPADAAAALAELEPIERRMRAAHPSAGGLTAVLPAVPAAPPPTPPDRSHPGPPMLDPLSAADPAADGPAVGRVDELAAAIEAFCAQPFFRREPGEPGRPGGVFRAVQVDQLRRAADRGDARAQFCLGLMADRGKGTKRDPAAAAGWYRKAADQGHAAAQNNLGVMYQEGRGVAKDEAAAAGWFRKAADRGDAEAQCHLGWMCQEGRGVPKDEAAAAGWYRRAADQGHPGAQNNLGVMYQEGIGVPQDDAAAVGWFRKAAARGNARGQCNLGVMFSTGRGVGKDDAAAVGWFRKAADQGHPRALYHLAVMYAGGRGVDRDEAAAAGWYRQAADQGHAAAQYNLGRLYEFGRGVAASPADALRWYRQAAAKGHADAKRAVARLAADAS